MEMIKRFEPFALLVMILGALNWGVLGLPTATPTCSPRSSVTARC